MRSVVHHFRFHSLVPVPYPNAEIRAESPGPVHHSLDHNNSRSHHLGMLWGGTPQGTREFHILVHLHVCRSICSRRQFLHLQCRRSYNGRGDHRGRLFGINVVRLPNKMGFHHDGWHSIRRRDNSVRLWNRCYFRSQQNCSAGVCISWRSDIFYLLGLRYATDAGRETQVLHLSGGIYICCFEPLRGYH